MRTEKVTSASLKKTTKSAKNNSHTYWSVGEMKKLEHLRSISRDWEYIAAQMGRSVGACKQRYTVVRIASLLEAGDMADTLKSWRNK